MDQKFSDLSGASPSSPLGGPENTFSAAQNRFLYVLFSFLILWMGSNGNPDLIPFRTLSGAALLCGVFVFFFLRKNIDFRNIFFSRPSSTQALLSTLIFVLGLTLSIFFLHLQKTRALPDPIGLSTSFSRLLEFILALSFRSWLLLLLAVVPLLSFMNNLSLLPFLGVFNLGVLGAITLSTALGSFSLLPIFFMGIVSSSLVSHIASPVYGAIAHSIFYFLLIFAIRVFL